MKPLALARYLRRKWAHGYGDVSRDVELAASSLERAHAREVSLKRRIRELERRLY